MRQSLFSKILGTNSGAALLQVMMVGTAIMTGSFYMTMQNNVSLKTIGGEYFAMETFTYQERLKEVLVDNGACRELFAGTDLPGLAPVNFNQLSPARYGLIATTNPDPAVQRALGVGENGMFVVREIRLSRAGPATAPIGEYGVLSIDIGIRDNNIDGAGDGDFVSNMFGPRVVTKMIPLFVAFNGNTVVDCYYDPNDTDRGAPDNSDGDISRAIADLCTGSNQPNTVGPQLTASNDCYTPGLNMEFDGAAYTTSGSMAAVGGEGQTLWQVRQGSEPFILTIRDGAGNIINDAGGNPLTVNLGNQPVIDFQYTDNPLWIPNMTECPPGQIIEGFSNVGTGNLNFQHEYNCRPMTADEIEDLVSTAPVNDCINSFDIQVVSGEFRIVCTEDEPGVERLGGGVAPRR